MTPRMYFERRLGFHRLDHRVREGFVKLDGHVSVPRRGCNATCRTCCNTFIASCGVMAPLVMSSSSESVRAMPMLQGHCRDRFATK